MKKLEGKVAIITGGSGGAGKAISRLFAAEGAKVVIAARGEQAAQSVVNRIHEESGEAIFVQTDVASEKQVIHCVQTAVETFGTVDILVNIACIMHLDTGRLHECSTEDFEQDIAVNLKSVFLFCKYVLPIMVKNGGGTIVNFSSVGGSRGVLGHTVYGAAKAGVESITRSIVAQYGKGGVRCNCIRPGVMTNDTWPDTPEINYYKNSILSHLPCVRIGTGEDAAPLALFLASDDSYYVNGQIITMDGGLTSHEPQWKEDLEDAEANPDSVR